MDSLAVLVNALLAGAIAAAKPMAEQAVTEGYQSLVALFKRKWGAVAVDAGMTGDRKAVTEAVQGTDAVKDPEVLRAAQTVLAAVHAHDSAAAAAVGIQISDLEAAGSISVEDLVVGAGPITVTHLKAGKNVRIKGVGNPRRR